MPLLPSFLRAHQARSGGTRSGTDPRVVVVTGASSGIGRAVALQAAGRGDHLVLAARDEASLRSVADDCERAGAASVAQHTGNVLTPSPADHQVRGDHGGPLPRLGRSLGARVRGGRGADS